ncbi:MAG: hypothetical protein NVS3B1_08640 [Marmoricola sp.]
MSRVAIIILVAALSAGCSTSASDHGLSGAATSLPSAPVTTAVPVPQPFPSVADTPLPPHTVLIRLAGPDAPTGENLSVDTNDVWTGGFRIDPVTNTAAEIIGGGNIDAVLAAAGSIWSRTSMAASSVGTRRRGSCSPRSAVSMGRRVSR